MTNEETDTALILEAELNRRVREVVGSILDAQVKEIVQREFVRSKNNMLLEISVSVGKMLQNIEKEGREPLWVTGPEALKQFEGGKNAVRE
jgi:hypothetical protein